MVNKKRRPHYYWWAWWSPLQEEDVNSVAWCTSEIGIEEHPGALSGAHSSLLRAGRAMYNAGLLKHPVKVQRAKADDSVTFTLSLRAPKV